MQRILQRPALQRAIPAAWCPRIICLPAGHPCHSQQDSTPALLHHVDVCRYLNATVGHLFPDPNTLVKCLQHTFLSCLSQTGDSQPCLVRCTECVLSCPLCCSLILRSQLVDSPAVCLLSEAPASDGATTPGALLLSEQDGSNAVVHLVIQRSAQVGTRVRGGLRPPLPACELWCSVAGIRAVVPRDL